LKLPKIRNPSEKIENIIQETALIGGFLMLAIGLYSIFPPAMWIICGLILMAFGIPWKQIRRKEGK